MLDWTGPAAPPPAPTVAERVIDDLDREAGIRARWHVTLDGQAESVIALQSLRDRPEIWAYVCSCGRHRTASPCRHVEAITTQRRGGR
jgi:hypothetical protein